MTGSNVSISGTVPEKTLGRIGESLADALSVITEPLGMIGDKVRFHREQMARKRIAGALKKAEDLQTEVKPAPLKFTYSWADAASLDEDKSDLSEMWENILLSAVTKYDSYLISFVEILKRVGGSEARVLQLLSAHISGGFNVGALTVSIKTEETEFPRNVKMMMNGRISSVEIWQAANDINNSDPRPYYVTGASIKSGSTNQFYYDDFFQKNYLAFDVLEREGVVSVSKAVASGMGLVPKATENGGHVWVKEELEVSIVSVRLTQFGIEFCKACMFPESRLKA